MVGLLLLSLLVGCAGQAPCPPGSAEDPDRAARLAGLAGLQAAGVLCFAPGAEPALLPGGVVRLDAAWPDAAAAARLAHLDLHRAPPGGGGDCDAAAVAQEAAAWHAELSLRRALGALEQAGSPPFAAAWGADPRPEVVAAWLRATRAADPELEASLQRLVATCRAAVLP